jgi:redox-sensitive bicupin YhaK (pirin superfamily)
MSELSPETAIALQVDPVSHDLGAFDVRRAVPQPKCRMVGPFVFIDQFGPAQYDIGKGMDVRPHPHIGLSTVTYLMQGAIDHSDSLGSFATIRPGAVNLMTAGSGIVHSERSPQSERDAGGKIYGTQTWLALPEALEETAPAFESVAAGDLPVVEDTCAKARVIMGSLWGVTAPTTCHAATVNADIILGAGGAMPIDADADERALLLVEGEAEVDGEPLSLFTLAVLRPGRAMVLRSGSGARVVLMGGEAMTRRHVWWNFVSSSRDRINQAKDDWRAGRFPKVPGDEEEFIPLPDVPKTVSYP